MRTNAHDPDGEEVIDTGLDDMMIDSNINIGLGSNFELVIGLKFKL